jgi:alanine-glyoxylate transaminase/serine-glyoxylate transaminase/serine-pyruvate transaminase
VKEDITGRRERQEHRAAMRATRSTTGAGGRRPTLQEEDQMQSFEPPRRTLLGPGPSDVPERVLAAQARPTIGHLDPAFIGLMEEIKELLRYTFRTENALTMPVSGPGTAGMESCVVNLVEPGETVVVCRNGVFGGRLREMVERCGGTAVMVEDTWGRAVTPEKVEEALRQHPEAVAVAVVQAETSTGALSDVREIAGIARRHGALSVVDAVTSLGGSPLEVDAWAVDAVYSGTQKCLSCPPGLAPLSFGERAVEKLRGRKTPVQSWFLDLSLVMAYWGDGAQRSYHHTAPVNSLYGLHEALLVLREEGLEESWARHERNHLALRAGLEALGLTYVVPEAERLPQLNLVTVPEGVDDARARRRLLLEHGVEIGAGLGALAGKVWRIGLMGHSSRPENVLLCVDALGEVLASEGHRVDAAGARRAAEARLDAAA